MKKSRLLGAVCACVTGIVFSTTAHAVNYTITALEPWTYGFDMSDNGQVAGVLSHSFTHAFLYDGTMHDLGAPSGASSEGFGVNNSGQGI